MKPVVLLLPAAACLALAACVLDDEQGRSNVAPTEPSAAVSGAEADEGRPASSICAAYSRERDTQAKAIEQMQPGESAEAAARLKALDAMIADTCS